MNIAIHMDVSIKQADNTFGSNRLQRIFGRSNSILKNFWKAYEQLGMKVQTTWMLFTEIIDGQDLESSGHRVSENIEEYLQNLVVKQATICSEGALQDEVVTRT